MSLQLLMGPAAWPRSATPPTSAWAPTPRRCAARAAADGARRCSLAPLVAGALALALRLVLRAPVGHLPRHADPGLRADRLVDRLAVGRLTGGSNGLVGIWPAALAGRPGGATTCFALALVGAAMPSAVAAAFFAVRLCPARGARLGAARRARAASTCRRMRWAPLLLAGAFAGLAGALYAFSKGSIAPELLAIPRSVDALVMVLLGGLQTLTGPARRRRGLHRLAGHAGAADRVLARAASAPDDPRHRAGLPAGHRRHAQAPLAQATGA